jgi:hypothetical protein
MPARKYYAVDHALTALWQSRVGRIVTGDHLFAESWAKLAVNVINGVDGSVRIPWNLSLCVE